MLQFPSLISSSCYNFIFCHLNSGNRNEALRIAFIDVVETLKEGKVYTEYFSKLVKADINGKDKVHTFSFSFLLSPRDKFLSYSFLLLVSHS